ncbi:MAG: proline dehydrogenase family protein [Jatrophihabitans sp.]
MANAALLALSRRDGILRAITRLPVTRSVVDRFVAGETDESVVAAVRALHERNLLTTIDRLGEDVDDRERADATAAAYVELLTRLGDAGLVPDSEVSLKLSAMGQHLPGQGSDVALANARRVCAAAQSVGTTVSVDMEDHTTVDATLSTVHELRQDFPWVAVAIQAALKRTENDLRDLAVAGSRVRLVKGAYAEPASVAHVKKAEVDASYARGIAILMAGAGYPQIGTHDPAMITRAEALAAEHGRDSASFEFQMLYGIRTDEQARLRAAGRQVRVYVPYGSDWYGYFVRRLAERPANVGFLARALVGR